ncbi:hypothetical protein MIND_00039900 [Mycena indigotica]|uniref:Extracellular membrane protein CFEM domain-containing protein n=1 Tax=Mycena indigotica TaxID=2126181 RepID=A0A8H6TD27_9AGAR|nr:uncharacterized protein MIND_00039900 [Mycena indigotica]KAF7315255.1 hypothetical protein MIND_00039900 [Mycena indigotica]
MFSKLVSIALLTALAGRALAFNVSVNKVVYQSTEVFDFNFTPVIASCQTSCNTAKATINACNDIGCFCGNTTTTELVACEQCIFTAIVDANVPPPDVRAGSNQILAGWTTNCAAANLTVTLGLELPASWDGPFVSVFPTAVGWVIAVTGGCLGVSLIYMLSNM